MGLPARLLPADAWTDSVVWMDLTGRLEFADASVEHVYSSHCLEHLTLAEERHVLSECLRVLQPGGVLRLVVPDLSRLVERYLRDREESPREASYRFHDNSGYFEFPPFSSWMVFTDQVSHACVCGQHALVNTWTVRRSRPENPDLSPFEILAHATG